MLLVALWEVVVRPIDLVVQWCYDKSRMNLGPEYRDPKYTFWYDELCLIGFGLAVTVAGLVILYRQTRSRGARQQDDRPGPGPAADRLPRGSGGHRPFRARPLPPGHDRRPRDPGAPGRKNSVWGRLHRLLCGRWNSARRVAVYRNVVHVLADIIVHFAGPGADKLVLGSPLTALRHPVRWRIARRFRAVLNLLLAGNPTHVLIVAHGRGP